ATLDTRDHDPGPPSTPGAAGETLAISPCLRRTGSYEGRAPARKVWDRSGHTPYPAEPRRTPAQETPPARARVAPAGTARLSEPGDLGPVAFGLFLQLLGDALARWGHGTTQAVATSNVGTMEIHLTAVEGGGTAIVRTPEGTFSGPDHLVHIIDVTRGDHLGG